MARKRFKKQLKIISSLLIILISFLTALYFNDFDIQKLISNTTSTLTNVTTTNSYTSYELSEIPEYTDSPYIVLNNNTPEFEDKEYDVFESYADLDYLNRAGVAFANLGIETMPTEDRESISHVKPTGWQSITYDNVDGKYLYNRCHLIGFQLSSENANENNLITGTRYFNVDGMLPFEDQVADYIKETNNHVLYRVTPLYEGTNLVASGVQIEAKSVEDNGAGIQFNVYVYNVQPGISINYEDGTSSLI